MCSLEFLVGVVPLTLCGIAYERVRSLPRIYHVKSVFPVWKVLLLTWGISAILSCHRFLAYEFYTNKTDCNGSEIAGNSSELRVNSLGDGKSNNSSVISHVSECRKVCKE